MLRVEAAANGGVRVWQRACAWRSSPGTRATAARCGAGPLPIYSRGPRRPLDTRATKAGNGCTASRSSTAP